LSNSAVNFKTAGSTIKTVNNITAVEGENWNLTCGVTGSPKPSVSWEDVETTNNNNNKQQILLKIGK